MTAREWAARRAFRVEILHAVQDDSPCTPPIFTHPLGVIPRAPQHDSDAVQTRDLPKSAGVLNVRASSWRLGRSRRALRLAGMTPRECADF